MELSGSNFGVGECGGGGGDGDDGDGGEVRGEEDNDDDIFFIHRQNVSVIVSYIYHPGMTRCLSERELIT